MRLFSTFKFMLSNGSEASAGDVDSKMQEQAQGVIKQTIPHADTGSATIAAGQTYTIPWGDATTSRERLLDLSVNGSCYLKITQDAVVREIALYGTTKTPARATLTLDAAVTQVQLVSRETTADTDAVWLYAEFTDIDDAAYFPRV